MYGMTAIGNCQFAGGYLQQNPNANIYRPPVMMPNYGVATPDGVMQLPQQFVDTNRPFARPMITTPAQAETCYLQGSASSGGVNTREFTQCMVNAMLGEKERAMYDCIRNGRTTQEQALCAVSVGGGPNEQRAAQSVAHCMQKFGTDYSRYPLCMAGQTFDGDTGKLVACVSQQGNNVTLMGTAVCYGTQSMKLNPELQIVAQCAMSTGGEPMAFAGCAGGQLTARELQKCMMGFGTKDGCFGPNNEVVKGMRQMGDVFAGQFGPNNDIVRN
jgi:hypothetical protein